MWIRASPGSAIHVYRRSGSGSRRRSIITKGGKKYAEKCYCIVIETGKNRFDRARERCRHRRMNTILAAAKSLLQYVGVMTLLIMAALGICVTLLALTSRVGVSCVGAVMITFGIAGPVGDALMRENG